MTTIADVARMAGVSVSTVSHVLNGTRFVRPETAQAVRDVIAKTGYTPNIVARSLARASTNSVGVAISVISNPYFSDIILAVELECSQLGMEVLFADTNDDPERELEVIQLLHQRRVDGIILATASVGDCASLNYLRENKLPTVLVDRLASDDFDQVGVENGAAVDMLVEHLARHGHRRIGFIPGQPGFATTIERTQGFHRSIARRDLDSDPALVAPGSENGDVAARSAAALMALAKPPSAIVTGNNLSTVGAMRGLKRAGICVPRHIALVGIDDFEWADSFEPQLTVIAQPCREIGRRAAELLLNRIKGESLAPQTVCLPTELVIRNSCGCVVDSHS